jgi:diacylglycerol kinase (ATP)
VQTSSLPSPLVLPDLVFVNPSAGGGHAADSLISLRAFAVRSAWHVEFRMTSSATDLDSKARVAAESGHSRLFVLGGDGSFQDLVNATANYSDVVLGILPAGSGNDLADALALPHHPVRAAELLRDGRVCLMDAVCVETADGQTRIYTGGGGVGIDAEASFIASTRFRNWTGRFRYLLSAAFALMQTRPTSIRVSWSANGTSAMSLATEALLVAVLNTPSYGSGLRFAPAAKINDGILDLVVVDSLPAFEFLKALPMLIFLGEVRSPRVKRFPIHQVKIETTIPCRFHGDGEILGYTPVKIHVLPGAIRILCPKDSPLST